MDLTCFLFRVGPNQCSYIRVFADEEEEEEEDFGGFFLSFLVQLGCFPEVYLANKEHVSHLSVGWQPAKVKSQIISPYSPILCYTKESNVLSVSA